MLKDKLLLNRETHLSDLSLERCNRSRVNYDTAQAIRVGLVASHHLSGETRNVKCADCVRLNYTNEIFERVDAVFVGVVGLEGDADAGAIYCNIQSSE